MESKKQLQEIFPELSRYRIDDKKNGANHNNDGIDFSSLPPKPIVIYGHYEGVNNDEGIAKIQGKTYFISKYNPPTKSGEAKVKFHDVTYTIPTGFFGFLPSGSRFIDPIFEFQDETVEYTSKILKHTVNGKVRIHGVLSGNHPITTVLSHHLHPQAGITVWRNTDQIKLLVSIN